MTGVVTIVGLDSFVRIFRDRLSIAKLDEHRLFFEHLGDREVTEVNFLEPFSNPYGDGFSASTGTAELRKTQQMAFACDAARRAYNAIAMRDAPDMTYRWHPRRTDFA